ncbi:MAG: hypothetical protein FWC43_02495 [Planctomycetaceae bacterium]|nr:hypothetical protein [Planctomycetaceae bacterium]
MKKRFLFLALLGLVALGLLQTASAQQWYKGQLHCHSLWSDGNTLPELAIDWYRSAGFHFMALTDHRVVQLDSNRWKEAVSALIEESRKKFGDEFTETKEENGKTLVRLKTYQELSDLFNKDGAFHLILGHEQDGNIGGRTMHANAINISEVIPSSSSFPTLVEAMLDWRKGTLENASKNDKVGFWMVNHPNWPYFDITPEVLIEASDVEFYEWNTTSPPRHVGIPPGHPEGTTLWDSIIHPDHPTFEKSWDIINSFRLIQGKKPIYMVASDDTHSYRTFEHNVANPGHGWVVVRSEKLEADSLFTAMKKGDFYSSTGVELKEIRFDAETGTLNVEVQPEENIFYSIRFVGTKKDFDTRARTFEDPAIGSFKPMRIGKAYSGDIGITFHTVTGTSASYQMAPDDLYVRAVVTSSKIPKYRARNKPLTENALTQPYYRPY